MNKVSKYSVSNIALPAYDHERELHQIGELGIEGLEVAPSRIWEQTWQGLTADQVEGYRRQVEEAGLSVVGLHSLLFDHKELAFFNGHETRSNTVDFLVHLSVVCRDLGGKTLVLGGGRARGSTPLDKATEEFKETLESYCQRVEEHGTQLCIEPLGPSDSDFINSVYDSIALVKAIDHDAIAVQIDAKALVENKEVNRQLFEDSKRLLVHYHANEPGLGILGTSNQVPHMELGGYLKEIDYSGFVSIEQRMFPDINPMDAVKQSFTHLQENY